MLDHSLALTTPHSASLGAVPAESHPLCGVSFLAGGIGGGYLAYKLGASIAGVGGGAVSLFLLGTGFFFVGGIVGLLVAGGLGFCSAEQKAW